MTDFRTLCAELVVWADKTSAHYYQSPEVLVRARAALAEIQSDGPSDEELLRLMPQQMRDDLAAAARALASFDPDNIKAASVFRIILNRHIADHAHAVLARWGTAAPQPIPVSQRLPEAGDCDEEERCWWWYAPVPEQTYGYWAHEDHAIPERALEEWPTHWLPAQALPLPSGKVQR